MQNPTLSTGAIKALVAVGTCRQGAAVNSITDKVVVAELQAAGLIGVGLGLTRRGTIVRQRLVQDALDFMF